MNLALQADLQNLMGLVNDGHTDKAISTARRLIAKYPKVPVLHVLLGVGLTNSGKLDPAVHSYRKALALKPDYVEAFNYLGITLHKQGKLAEAEQAYTTALKLQPDNAEAARHIVGVLDEGADAAVRRRDLKQALASYRKLLSFRPEDSTILANIGSVLTNLGQFNEAAPFLSRALAYEPQNIRMLALTALGQRGLQKPYTAFLEQILVAPERHPKDDRIKMWAAITLDRPEEAFALKPEGLNVVDFQKLEFFCQRKHLEASVQTLPEIKGSPPANTGKPLIFAAADGIYAQTFAATLIQSALSQSPDCDFHLHVMNPGRYEPEQALRVHTIRYEDMHAKPEDPFTGVARFLGLPNDTSIIAQAIKAASFKTLRAQEESAGFKEREYQTQRFFREGRAGGWREKLTADQAARIAQDHAAVMQAFGYLDRAILSAARGGPVPSPASAVADAQAAAEWLAAGDSARAERFARTSLAKTESAEAFGILAAAQAALGKRAEAAATYRNGRNRFSDNLPLAANYARFLRDQPEHIVEAIAIFKDLVVRFPGGRGLRLSLIETLRTAAQTRNETLSDALKEAESLAREFIALYPSDSAGPLVLALILFNRGEPLQTIAAADTCISLRKNGDARNAHRALEIKANAHIVLGAVSETIACYRTLLTETNDPDIHSRLLMAMQYADTIDEPAIFAETKSWAAAHTTNVKPRAAWPNAAFDPQKRLNVGFLSRDFRLCSTLFLARPLFDNRPADWSVTFYSNAEVRDGTTRSFQNLCNRWRDIHDLTDDEAAAFIATDGIDVLVDINGHTLGGRPGVFARKPAPVQVSWLDYVGSTGLSTIDAVIGDAGHLPLTDQRWYAEPIVHVADNLYRYAPPPDAPFVGPLPAAGNGYVTFGCFNSAYKISPTTVALWAEILRNLPSSRLLLNAREFQYADTKTRFAAMFARHSVEAGRLIFHPGAADPMDMLRAYGDIDIALDPMPYSGGLATIEALSMGVPVITRPGNRFGSRHSSVHLRTVGLDSWIAKDAADYVALASSKAADISALAVLRGALPGMLQRSALMDGAGFAKAFGDIVRDLWIEACGRQQQIPARRTAN